MSDFDPREPFALVPGGGCLHTGATMRDYFAAHAPISDDLMRHVYGKQTGPMTDSQRASYFAVMALLRYEYADAMMGHRAALSRLSKKEA